MSTRLLITLLILCIMFGLVLGFCLAGSAGAAPLTPVVPGPNAEPTLPPPMVTPTGTPTATATPVPQDYQVVSFTLKHLGPHEERALDSVELFVTTYMPDGPVTRYYRVIGRMEIRVNVPLHMSTFYARAPLEGSEGCYVIWNAGMFDPVTTRKMTAYWRGICDSRSWE